MEGSTSGLSHGSGGNNRTGLIVSIVLIVILAVVGFMEYRSITQKKQEIATLQEEKQNLLGEQAKLNDLVTEVTGTVAEIGNKLKDVREKQVTLGSLIKGPEAGKTDKARILDDIAAIEGQLQSDKQSLDALEAKMKKSAIRIRALEVMVANLKKEVENNQATIASLQASILEKDQVIKTTRETLATTQENLKGTETRLKSTEQTLEETRNTAYYVVGNAKELEAKKVIDRFGVFIKRNALASDLEVGSFNKIDKTKMLDFQVGCKAKDIKIVPPRIEGSYSIAEVGEGQSVLKVVDQEKFWKVPYLAIVTK